MHMRQLISASMPHTYSCTGQAVCWLHPDAQDMAEPCLHAHLDPARPETGQRCQAPQTIPSDQQSSAGLSNWGTLQ